MKEIITSELNVLNHDLDDMNTDTAVVTVTKEVIAGGWECPHVLLIVQSFTK